MYISITHDLEYLAIFAFVLILPKILMRFRIPSGITALVIGLIVGYFDPTLDDNQLFRFLSQIGITSLFVFAGLEVNFKELKQDKIYLSKYLVKSILGMILIAFAIRHFFQLSFQNSLILSLGIFTPSAGFIINSLHSFNMHKDLEYWIKSKAISKEIVSIVILFIALQFNNFKLLSFSLLFYIILFLTLPKIFKFFFKFISPHALNTEVLLLVVLSLICGVISKELGAYYLVGAFIVGLIGSRFKKDIFHEDEEFIFKALNNFFNVFLPFYFFFAGLKMPITAFNLDAFQYGLPVRTDNELFGRLILEINQAGLNWTTILKKEANFKKAYSNFKIQEVASYKTKDINRLLNDSGIIRNKLKINAAIYNANIILELKKEYDSFKKWLNHHHPLTKDEWVKLFKKTFKFTGGEITNEFLMSTGYLKGAHHPRCKVYQQIAKLSPKWQEK